MEILVALGEIYGSEKMIPVTSAHVSSCSYKTSGSAGSKFVRSLADTENKFKVLTTLNPLSVDDEHWMSLGFAEEDFKNQMITAEAYRRLGGVCLYTCTPYLVGNLPKFGDHIAWAESEAVIFVNSVIGARTNREGGISALAAGLTGRTPFYGYHLYENRKATVLIENRADLRSSSDYSALGYHLGTLLVGKEVPLLTNLGRIPSIEDLKAFSAGIATSGNATLFHIEGVTPESTDSKLVAKVNMKQKIIVSDEDINAVYRKLSTAIQSDIDFVGIGCPHLSITEIGEIASIFEAKRLKVHPKVRLWIYTSSFIKGIADRMGFSKAIIEAGGEMVCNTCPILACIDHMALKNFATNCAKAAHYAPSMSKLNPFFGTLEDCINAAVTGEWKERV